MQDFRNYSYKLTVNDLKRIIEEDNQEVIVIINGEYYEVESEGE